MQNLVVITWPVYVILVGIKLCLVLPILWKWNFPLWQIPGPRAAAWSRYWLIKTLYSGDSAQEFVRLSKTYGPVMRIAPNTVMISEPNTIRRLLGVNSGYTRGPWFDSLRIDPYTTTVVSERNPKKHQNMRQVLAAGLSGKDVPGVEGVVGLHVKNWMQILSEKHIAIHEGALRVNLSRVLPFLSMDVITHLCLGESFGDVSDDNDQYGLLKAPSSGMVAQQYIASILELKSCLIWLGGIPFLRKRLFPSAEQSTGIGQVMQVIEHKVQSKMANHNKEGPMTDMLDAFLARDLPPLQAQSELVVVLFSAVGATSYTMQGIIRGIIGNPIVCQRVQHEIDLIVEENGLSRTEILSDTNLRSMPYLQACISEGLRMYPAITQLRERVVPPEGDNLDGYYVPGGTFVALNGLISQTDPIYGEDLDVFGPERWLVEDKILVAKMRRNLEINFGHGSSKCLGVNLANTEMNKVIFELFRNYDVTMSNLARPWVSRGDFVLADFEVVLRKRRLRLQINRVPTLI